MLIALLAAYFLSGGAGASAAILTPDAIQEVSRAVETQVEDPARAEAAAETLKALKREVKAFDKAFGISGKELTRLYKDPSAASERLTETLDRLNEDWAASQRRALDLRFELRDSLTEDEWSALFGDR